MQKFPTQLLKDWFIQNKRDLPWRANPTPYRVWISEVMLQQTQVKVVIPYFEQWMRIFPTIEALAKAPEEQVIKHWEGLGYYSRARNLHHAARYLLEYHAGNLPSAADDLAKIKGIGPYTQGAIRSFAFHQKAAAVDGNVLRVLSRFLGFQEEIDTLKSKQKLHSYAEDILPDHEPWLIGEGLIELGATICMKKAKCEMCPLRKECLAFRHHLQAVLPKKKERPQTILLKRNVAVISCQGHFLLQKGEKGKVMADLYEFPYIESDEESASVHRFEEVLQMKLTYVKSLPQELHTFTRYRATLFPHLLETDSLANQHLWVKQEDLNSFPFSSGHKRILRSL